MRNVADFTIAADGHLYLLYRDGVMKRYFGGSEVAFTFSGFNEGSEPSTVLTEGFFLNDSPFAPGFFLVSRGARTIFETTAAGTFMDSYQAFDQQKLDLIVGRGRLSRAEHPLRRLGQYHFQHHHGLHLGAHPHATPHPAVTYGRAGGKRAVQGELGRARFHSRTHPALTFPDDS